MAHIFFFSIPAHGHVNPTLPLVRELILRGHTVRYYETEEFRSRIEDTGAEFADIGPYMPPAPADVGKVAGKDFASLIEMAAHTTLGLDQQIAKDVAQQRPDLIISDSICFWGKLLARKHGIPFVCSTTSFAFNEHTAKRMKQKPAEILRMILGMPRIDRAMQRLREAGHDVKSFVDVIGNDNDTNTIVYTSRLFQPESETFSDRYAFIGPSVPALYPRKEHARPQVYISLGTVLHDAPRFYKACIRALSGMDADAILSIGSRIDPASLGPLPENVRVYPRVNQLEVLASCDVFLTHCGMNSASESLLCGVPMVLFPQHSEETAVADRIFELGAGLRLKRVHPASIRRTLEAVLADPAYRSAAGKIADDFAQCPGPAGGADYIESVLAGSPR